MRIWSLHPKYLDAKGLVALWRETLLAKHVLFGKTKGYKEHPQLLRFKRCPHPVDAIDQYLIAVHIEATARGYRFDKDKIGAAPKKIRLTVTKGQLAFETTHLLNKLKVRDPGKCDVLQRTLRCAVHPLFTLVDGDVEEWERI